jgi:2-C-methyl-D-erythritol 2,4-cyclodiphosphate synthase
MAIRIGHGYDLHRLVEGRRLVLGGLEIPHSHGLLGHSDADVVLHAVSDGILGALGASTMKPDLENRCEKGGWSRDGLY